MTISVGLFDQDTEHFALFIRNKDGQRWNEFVKGMCSIYFAADDDSHRVSAGMYYAKYFVKQFYSEFL